MPPEYGSREWFDSMFEGASKGHDRWGHQWRASQRFRYGIYDEIIGSIVSPSSDAHILDIGCGMGNYTASVSKRFSMAHVIGMDISKIAIGFASKNYDNLSFFVGSLPFLPVKGGCFSHILCLETLYYLNTEDRANSLARIHDALGEGGLLVLSGGLDDGTRYFEENHLLEMLKDYEIETLRYNYALIYARMEKYAMRGLDLFNLIRTGEVSVKAGKAGGVKTGVAGIERIGLSIASSLARRRRISVAVSDLFSNALMRMLSWNAPVRISFRLSKLLFGKRGRTHIIVVAKKVGGRG